MGSLSSIVSVQVSRLTKVPTRAGFGTGAFLADDTTLSSLTRIYTSYEAMAEDPELTGSAALDAGAAYFGQQLSAPKFTVIKQESGIAQVAKLTFSGALVSPASTVVKIDGNDLAAVPFNTDNATTLADIAAAIQADALVATAVVSGSNAIIVTAANPDESFAISALVSGLAEGSEITVLTQYTTQAGGITGSLNNAISVNNDWYGLAISSRDTLDIIETAAWVQAQGSNNPKLFFAQSSNANILDAADETDVASNLTAASMFRTAIMYHAIDTEYADCAWMGGQLPTDVGSITWAYKGLSLVTVDSFKAGEKEAAHAKNCNTYDLVANTLITEEGKTCDGGSGEFIDTIRGVDWIQVNAQADLYSLLVLNPKIPYTSQGISAFTIQLQNTLKVAQNMGILSLDKTPSVTAPTVEEVSAADKAGRVLNNLEFTAVLAGAIQKVNVRGNVTL